MVASPTIPPPTEYGYRMSRSNNGDHYIYVWDRKGNATFHLTEASALQLIKDLQEVVLNDIRN